MNKLSLVLISFLCVLQTYAGSKMTCPDLNRGDSTSGWTVIGTLNKAEFKNVLISQSRVMGQNTVTCKYDSNLILMKIGNFQIASNDGLWQSVNLGGVLFKQCLATLQMCSFYGA